MTQSDCVHRLQGLEPDNMLAFLALLGLLRALEQARPNWHRGLAPRDRPAPTIPTIK
jgi:hypothetical protein